MRIPIQVDRQARTILGVLDLPSKLAHGCPVILLNYGLNGDRVDNHRLSILLAARANSAGIALCRFDYHGCGLSSGEFFEASVGTKAADALAVIEFIRGSFLDEPFHLILLGYSDGIRVVHTILKTDRRVAGICAWNPIVHSMTHTFRSARKARPVIEPTTKKVVFPVFGVYMGLDYLVEVNRNMPVDDLLETPIPKLFVFGGSDNHTISFQRDLRARQRQWPTLELAEIPGANHIFNRVTWSNELVQTTVDWVLRVSR